MFSLRDWYLEDMGAFIEAQGYVIRHEYFAEGDFIGTAPIKNIELDKSNQSILFSTSCGTKYILRFSEINGQKSLQTKKIIRRIK